MHHLLERQVSGPSGNNITPLPQLMLYNFLFYILANEIESLFLFLNEYFTY